MHTLVTVTHVPEGTVTESESPVQMSRKARFKAALGLARITMRQWATEHGVTRGHVHAVLNGRESPRLISSIDAFIAKQLGESIPPQPASTAMAKAG